MNEQFQEAERKFEKAIEEFMEARGQKDGLLTGWVIITSEHLTEKGSTSHGIYTPMDQEFHKTIGLLEYAKIRSFINMMPG